MKTEDWRLQPASLGHQNKPVQENNYFCPIIRVDRYMTRVCEFPEDKAWWRLFHLHVVFTFEHIEDILPSPFSPCKPNSFFACSVEKHSKVNMEMQVKNVICQEKGQEWEAEDNELQGQLNTEYPIVSQL